MAKFSYTVTKGNQTKSVTTSASTISEGQKKIAAAYDLPTRKVNLKPK